MISAAAPAPPVTSRTLYDDDYTSRRSSTVSIISQVPASDAHARLCHVCGCHFRKAQLPAHHKLCIRTSVRISMSRRASEASVLGGYHPMDQPPFMMKEGPGSHHQQQQHYQQQDPSPPPTDSRYLPSPEIQALQEPQYYPCANCKRQVLQEKLTAHMKSCHGAAAHRSTRIPTPVTYPAQTNFLKPMFAGMKATFKEIKTTLTERKGMVAAQPPMESAPVKVAPYQQQQRQQYHQHHTQQQQHSVPVRNQEPDEYDDDDFEPQSQLEDPPNDFGYPVERETYAGASNIPEESMAPVMNRTPCNICGRKFVEDALNRHIPACQKLNGKKRPVYNSSKIRAQGTELESFQRKNIMKEMLGNGGGGGGSTKKLRKKKPAGGVSSYEDKVIPTLDPKDKKASDWRTKHDQFIQNIRMAKLPADSEQARRMMAQRSAAADPNPDYVQCNFCDRRFNEQAAERHIPVCKQSFEKSRLHPSSNRNTDVATKELQSLQRRLSFRPPPPKNKTASGSTAGAGAGGAGMVAAHNPNRKKASTMTTTVASTSNHCCSGCGGSFATEKARFCFECGTKRDK